VGNLDASVSEDLVCALFSQIGPVKGCKIIREVRWLPYTFICFCCSGHLREKFPLCLSIIYWP